VEMRANHVNLVNTPRCWPVQDMYLARRGVGNSLFCPLRRCFKPAKFIGACNSNVAYTQHVFPYPKAESTELDVFLQLKTCLSGMLLGKDVCFHWIGRCSHILMLHTLFRMVVGIR
jgi:hypothetical protein